MPMEFTKRPATTADTGFDWCLHHAAYRGVVIAQFGIRDQTQQGRMFELDWSDQLDKRGIYLPRESVDR